MKYHEIIEDICYIYLHIPDESILTRKPSRLVARIFRILFSWGKHLAFKMMYLNRQLVKGFNSNANPEMDAKLWLVINSINTQSSLSFIAQSDAGARYLSTSSAPKTDATKDIPRICLHQGLWQAYRFFGAYAFICRKHGKIKARKIIDIIFEAVISYEGALKLLASCQPSAMVFGNDHLFKNRALLHGARKHNIPTIYIQHASVSDYFPPLLYDMSLLEGEDAFKKYKSNHKPVEGKVHLIGMPKYDSWLQHRRSDSRNKIIGICGNLLDENSAVLALIRELSVSFPDREITYRPHPRDQRNLHLPKGIKISQASSDNIFAFLESIDVLIASNTSTHLEATLMNIPSVYYEFGTPPISDYYGYVAHGMIEHAAGIPEVIEFINAVQFSATRYMKAQYYNDVLDHEWEGRSSALAMKYISEVSYKDK